MAALEVDEIVGADFLLRTRFEMVKYYSERWP